MSFVDVVMTIGEKDEITDYDCRVMDALERLYPHTRSMVRTGILPALNKALTRDKASHGTWLGRRPLEVPRVLASDDTLHEYLIVALPLGSTWRAVNAGFMFIKDLVASNTPGEMEGYEISSAIRDFAHKSIVPLLDAQNEFSRYPFDVKIAFDLMFTLKLALTRGYLGRGQIETIDSIYLKIDNHEYQSLTKRENRQLALVFQFNRLPG